MTASWNVLTRIARIELKTVGLSLALLVPLVASSVLLANDWIQFTALKGTYLVISLKMLFIYAAGILFYVCSAVTRIIAPWQILDYEDEDLYVKNQLEVARLSRQALERDNVEGDIDVDIYNATLSSTQRELVENAAIEWNAQNISRPIARGWLAIGFAISLVFAGYLAAIDAPISVLRAAGYLERPQGRPVELPFPL